MSPELISPELWSRMIRDALAVLRVSTAVLAELLEVSDKTIYAWKKGTRTPPAKRMGQIQQRLLQLGVPPELVHSAGKLNDDNRPLPQSTKVDLALVDRRRRSELGKVFRVIEKTIAKQNTTMVQELKNALTKLLQVEANELSEKK